VDRRGASRNLDRRKAAAGIRHGELRAVGVVNQIIEEWNFNSLIYKVKIDAVNLRFVKYAKASHIMGIEKFTE
jgi:hypothetical protein